MKKHFSIIICLLICVSCSFEHKTADNESELVFEKLLGTWKLNEEPQFEKWTKNNDGSYSSHVFSVSGKDTTTMEKVSIFQEADKWHFKTLVKDQNKGKTITFTSTKVSDVLVQFENPAHDFPRIIHYRLISQNNLQAFIAGTKDTIYFNFTRAVSK